MTDDKDQDPNGKDEDDVRSRPDKKRGLEAERQPQAIEVNDALILRLLDRGDFRALDLLVQCYGARLVNFLEHITHDRAAAEDVCHDVFVKLFEGHADCREPGAFATWLFRVARNHALDQLRRKEVHKRVVNAIGQRETQKHHLDRPRREVVPDPLEEIERAELKKTFDDAIASLPERYRSVFVLREIEDMSYREIALVCSVPEKTVSTRLFRARRELRDQLEPYLRAQQKGHSQ